MHTQPQIAHTQKITHTHTQLNSQAAAAVRPVHISVWSGCDHNCHTGEHLEDYKYNHCKTSMMSLIKMVLINVSVGYSSALLVPTPSGEVFLYTRPQGTPPHFPCPNPHSYLHTHRHIRSI